MLTARAGGLGRRRSVAMTPNTAKVIPFPSRPRARRLVRVAFILATACAIAAIVVQDHTSYLPLGVFNTGARQLGYLADALLVIGAAMLVLQVLELRTGRFARACGWFRGV